MRKAFLTLIFAGAAGCSDYSTYETKEVEENETLPEACVSNDNVQEIAQETPQLYLDLVIMEKLPLTGATVYEILKDPANGITTCRFPVSGDDNRNCTYSNQNVRLSRGSGTGSAFHEYFHAAQDVNNGNTDMFDLTMKDAAIASLLEEASAVAYVLAAQQEAANRGLEFFMNSERFHASDEQENIDAFHDAYTAAWEKNAGLVAQAREAKSLEAGGQAVVRRLMDGEDLEWRIFYADQAISNINNNSRAFRDDGREFDPDYKDTRYLAYSKLGLVSPQINFIPGEYLGAEADAAIDKCFAGMGFQVVSKTPSPPPVRTARHNTLPWPDFEP
ncbi:MAG: hypothetical protein K8R48_07475 [Alphaproteobacteria bacterium]|nr:hypothetical protein [Alphaproteobacteria bacterium]